VANYEITHRKTHGPLRQDAVDVVDQFYRCGDLAAGFTRLQCPDCGHEKLLAFSCKTRGFCPSCHQRKVKQTGHWIAHEVCFHVPHRQFVFTMPKPLRGIFRKRRKLLTILCQEATSCLRDWFRSRLDLPDGELAAIAGVQTFGDYLVFHPHLHVLAAAGLIDADGTFHEMPVESIEPLEELFRHRFLAALRREKLISEKKLRQLLGWTHSGFNLDAGKDPIGSHDAHGRQLILRLWGSDPMECPCCHATMKNKGKLMRPEEIQFFLMLHGLWEGVIALPPPPDPPYDVESIEPLDVPPVSVWAGETELPPKIWWECGAPVRTEPKPPELELDDGRVLVLDGDPGPAEEWPVFSAN